MRFAKILFIIFNFYSLTFWIKIDVNGLIVNLSTELCMINQRLLLLLRLRPRAIPPKALSTASLLILPEACA